MKIFIITAFPNIVQGPLSDSILKRAREKGLVDIEVIDLRDFSMNKHRHVDDYPFGGGPGMVLKPEPFFRAVDWLRQEHDLSDPEIVLMTPQGEQFDQQMARQLTAKKEFIFLCGHYKGIDERVREFLATREISIGDYILTGGELPAMVVVDAVVRLLPGVIGDFDSARSDSFERRLLDCPYYTRPENFRGMGVPEVLLSGNHAEIEKWRKEMARARTQARRADLYNKVEEFQAD